MYVRILDLNYPVTHFLQKYEKIYPWGMDLTTDTYWELVDAALLDKPLRSYYHTDLFIGLSETLTTAALEELFQHNFEILNKVLDNTVPEPYRSLVPDTVLNLSTFVYKIYWRLPNDLQHYASGSNNTS